MVQSRGLAVMLAVLVFASSPAVLGAQQPISDREPQGTEPEPRRPATGLVKKIRAWFDKQQERYEEVADRLDRVGLGPDVGTLGQGSGLAAGVTFRRDALGGPGLDLETSAGFSYRGTNGTSCGSGAWQAARIVRRSGLPTITSLPTSMPSRIARLVMACTRTCGIDTLRCIDSSASDRRRVAKNERRFSRVERPTTS